MARSSVLLTVLTLIFVTSGWIVALEGGQKNPLDLPAGGEGSDEDEEDAPEAITFYGAEYEGDAFFWCLDKSCSMGGSPLNQLKQEMASAVTSLSTRAEFSMVAFHTNFSVWQQMPVRATPSNKQSAIVWVQALQAAQATCITAAGVKTLEIANISSKRSKTVIFVGDGLPECPPPNTAAQNQNALNGITAANWQGLPINTVYVSNSNVGLAFFQELAIMNGGTCQQP